MGDIGEKVAGTIAAIISLAIVAIVVSNQANTTAVVGTFFAGVSNLIGVAISPITGGQSYGSALPGGNWAGGGQTSGFAINPTNMLSGGGGFIAPMTANLMGGSGGGGGGGNSLAGITNLLGSSGGSGGGGGSWLSALGGLFSGGGSSGGGGFIDSGSWDS